MGLVKIRVVGSLDMRDPFGLECNNDEKGNLVTLWIVDYARLSSPQINAIAKLIAARYGINPIEVAAEAAIKGGFMVRSQWIESMLCGAEGMYRTKELADFLESAPEPPSSQAWQDFYSSQHDRWINGDEEPPPLPNRIEDFDERLRTPELEVALQRQQINHMLQGYSVFDVLTGTAMVDVLNQLDPDHDYSFVGDDDEDDDDIYE